MKKTTDFGESADAVWQKSATEAPNLRLVVRRETRRRHDRLQGGGERFERLLVTWSRPWVEEDRSQTAARDQFFSA